MKPTAFFPINTHDLNIALPSPSYELFNFSIELQWEIFLQIKQDF